MNELFPYMIISGWVSLSSLLIAICSLYENEALLNKLAAEVAYAKKS